VIRAVFWICTRRRIWTRSIRTGTVAYQAAWMADQPGQFILTGSQNLLLMEKVTESLAGRSAVLKLLPLTLREMAGDPQRPLPWEANLSPAVGEALSHGDLWRGILRGSYPELAANPQRDARLWQSSYVQTYLERDVRNLRNIGDLTQFQTFLRSLAIRSAGLLNERPGQDVGISVNTARDWVAILEASFQVFLLRPYFVNLGKRLVKSPKVYFTDTGLLCYLVGLRDAEHAAAGPMGGALLENLVVAELFKTGLHRGEEPAMYFWRTAAGTEVDLVIENQAGLIPIEIKASATARPEMALAIAAFRRDYGDRTGDGYVIYPGPVVLPLGGGTLALPLAAI
jgi:predicted AAA+ superfamily ATPase